MARSTRDNASGSKAKIGDGGELHQTASGAEARITTNHGVPVSDNQNSLRAGGRGPTLLEDFVLREKIQHFDHERIPERIVHARGSAAHGFFELHRGWRHGHRQGVRKVVIRRDVGHHGATRVTKKVTHTNAYGDRVTRKVTREVN